MTQPTAVQKAVFKVLREERLPMMTNSPPPQPLYSANICIWTAMPTKRISLSAKHKKLTIITMNTKMRSYLLSHYEKNIKIKKRYQNNTTPDLKMKKLYKNIDTLPSEFELAVINESIYLQSLKNTWSEYFVKNFKNYQDFSEHGLGYAVLCKGKLVSGASSYSYCRTGYEVVVATDPDFRRQGLALTCSSAFLIECAKRNKIPYWDCANKKSLSLSKKIGYSLVREYEGIRIVTTDTIS